MHQLPICVAVFVEVHACEGRESSNSCPLFQQLHPLGEDGRNLDPGLQLGVLNQGCEHLTLLNYIADLHMNIRHGAAGR